jgi:hypothetical protein
MLKRDNIFIVILNIFHTYIADIKNVREFYLCEYENRTKVLGFDWTVEP